MPPPDPDRRERFTALFEATYDRVLGYALRRADGEADAHDVVAETYLVAWRRLEDVPDGDRARLWLYGTARRVLANQHRARRRREQLTARVAADPAVGGLVGARSPDPAERAVDGDRRVAAAFARVPEAHREVLVLVGWEGLDAGEVAEVLGCTRTTARVRLHRARRRFAAELAAEEVERPAAAGHLTARRVTARPRTEEAL